jgi:hypothetical protein
MSTLAIRHRSVFAIPFILGLSLLTGCGGDNTYSPTVSGSGGGTPPNIGISIQSPNPAQCVVLANLQYGATVTGTSDTKVDWSIVSANGGSISSNGVYTAPSIPGTYIIKAAADADKSVYATATATVVAAPVITITIQSPNPAQCVTGGTLQYSSTITGGSDGSYAVWSVVTSNGGSITQEGSYTAPAKPGIYTIKAAVAGDTSVYATATATVVVGTGGLGGTIQ